MKIGIIGAGNMGTALIKGYVTVKPSQRGNVSAYDMDTGALNNLSAETGARGCKSIEDLVMESDILILAVKPDVIGDVIKEITKADCWEEKVIVSIAAGISLKYIYSKCKEHSDVSQERCEFSCKAVRVMPNTPALIGEGMSALVKGEGVSEDEFANVLEIFSSVGRAEAVDESALDSVVAVSGSAPAYVYMFIEALADGAVALGMSRKQAYLFAAQTVAGSANMVLKTGLHPGDLKDRVCSPGGTTIEAVGVLEEKGFRDAVISAAKAAGNKSLAMTK